MADHLTDMMHRQWNLTNSDATSINNGSNTNRSSSVSGYNSDPYNNYSHHQYAHQNRSSMPSPPTITTTDYSDPSSLSTIRVPSSLYNRHSLDTAYDTDGGIGTSRSSTKRHPKSSNGYEHLVSPRLPSKRSLNEKSKQLSTVPSHHYSSQSTHLTVDPYSKTVHNSNDKDDESLNGEDTSRRHIRLSRRVHHPPPSPAKNHGIHASHSPKISRHEAALATTASRRSFRLIFMRHSERVNQALGPDWYVKAFRTGTYQVYDQNLPMALPKRRSDEAYQYDAPLTARGLKNARNTGSAMMSTSLVPDVCLSSTALRCVQTAERILTGMNLRERIPIRIEPGLFECPHLIYKIVDSFMTKKELVENGYNIKQEYKPLIDKIDVPESLDAYFTRCVTVMQGIIDRYSHYGSTVLIVTHAPGLLALTDAIKGKRPDHETFYRTVATYPPLAMYIAEYDGTNWKFSDQPFALTPIGK